MQGGSSKDVVSLFFLWGSVLSLMGSVVSLHLDGYQAETGWFRGSAYCNPSDY